MSRKAGKQLSWLLRSWATVKSGRPLDTHSSVHLVALAALVAPACGSAQGGRCQGNLLSGPHSTLPRSQLRGPVLCQQFVPCALGLTTRSPRGLAAVHTAPGCMAAVLGPVLWDSVCVLLSLAPTDL